MHFTTCPHVRKSIKATFSNWWLEYKDDGINLGILELNSLFESGSQVCRKFDTVVNNDRIPSKAAFCWSSFSFFTA